MKWLMGSGAAPAAARHALRSVAVALVAVSVDTGLLNDGLGRAVVRVLGALFGS